MFGIGKSDEEKRREAQREQHERQASHQMAQATMQQAMADDDGTEAGEVMRYLSEIDDVPMPEGATLEQFFSKVESTANLSPEDIHSDEWVKEYLLMRWRHQYPPEQGLTGVMRGVAFDDKMAERHPVGQTKKTNAEGAKHVSQHALTRSEDMKAVEESTRTIAETVRHDNDDSGGGILGMIR